MRYFIFTSNVLLESGSTIASNRYVQEKFPSRTENGDKIKKECKELGLKVESIAVVNIFEFKNKEDYDNYNK